ncbi:MAG TPA: aldo/keto reductase [Fimbriimonadaceae bacterium]|nr:aldo/keto reductase [Fimbriimonadaceae bacterium]HRJ97044.1 aldo/keto reductase [Fimbriimonadaceae bacterium]
MEYRSLGRTGVQVSVACLGTMTFGWEPDDWGSPEDVALRVAAKALDLGINFWDTADVYGRGTSETIVGKALRGKRDRIVLATKCHGTMADDDPNASGNSRRHIIEACEASLRRLGTDWIDLYQIHRPQPSIPIDETLRALDDLIRQGKVRYAGASTYGAWQLCEAHYVAKTLGINGFVCEQPPYNLLDRRIERELLPFCRTYDYGVIPWSPLAGGQLSGKYLDDKPADSRYGKSDPMGRITSETTTVVKGLKAIADGAGLTLTQLSLAWIAGQPGITSPIIGARSEAQLEESTSACQIKLEDRVREQIDAVIAPGTNVANYYTAPFGPNARPNA